jgi:Protein of unknown function (DUF3300)
MKRMQFWMAWLSTIVLLTGTTSLEGCGAKGTDTSVTTAREAASAPAPETHQQQPQAPQGQPTAQEQQQQNEAAAANNPPQTQLPQMNLTAAGLDEILAPIALYPDPVLALMLQASVNPQEVMDGGNWLALPDNSNLKEAALDEASKKAGFTPVMQGLLHFGPVIDMMCTQFDWTKQLGASYAADPKSVLDSVQRLRAQAMDTGALKSSPQMKVDVKQEQGKEIIQLEPADPKVVYVPQYNPDQVYGTTTTTTTNGNTTTTTTTTTGTSPTTSTNSTVVVQQEKSGVSTGTAVLIGLLSFGAGMAVGAAINNNNYYYPAWGYGGVYYGGRPYYPPPYHPVYYGGWHGGYGYNRPVHYGNTNVNVNVNNNYYNRFNNNNNLNVNYKPRPVPYNSNPNSAYAKSAGNYQGANKGVKYNGSSNYRQPTTYQGANNRQPNAGNVQNRPGNANAGSAAVQRPTGGNAGSNANVQRPTKGAANNSWKGQSTYQGNKTGGANAGANKGVSTGNMPARNPSGDRGYGQTGGTRPTSGNMQNTRPTSGNMQDLRPTGGTQPGARPTTQPAARPATQQENRPPSNSGGALGGGSNAKEDRSASDRGRQSMGALQKPAGGSRQAAPKKK